MNKQRVCKCNTMPKQKQLWLVGWPHVHSQCACMFSARLSEEAISGKVTFSIQTITHSLTVELVNSLLLYLILPALLSR